MKCIICGTENDENSTICIICGSSLNKNNQQTNTDENLSSTKENLQIGTNEEPSSKKLEKNQKNSLIKNNINKVIAIISAVIILIATFVLYFSVISPSPKRVYENAVDKIVKQYQETIINHNSIEASVKTTFKTNNNDDIGKILNNSTLDMEMGIDKKKKQLIEKIDIKYKSKDAIKATFIYDNNLYVKLEKIYDQIIRIEDESISEKYSDYLEKEKLEDLNIVINSLSKAVKSSLKSEYFSKEKNKIKLNGKNKEVNTYKLILNEKNMRALKKDISEKLVKDEEFIKAYATLNNSTNKEIKKILKDNDNMGINQELTIYIYTKGLFNKFIGIKIQNDESSINIIKENKEKYILSLDNTITKFKAYIESQIDLNKKIKIPNHENAINIDQIDITSLIEGIEKSEGLKEMLNDLDYYDTNF